MHGLLLKLFRFISVHPRSDAGGGSHSPYIFNGSRILANVGHTASYEIKFDGGTVNNPKVELSFHLRILRISSPLYVQVSVW